MTDARPAMVSAMAAEHSKQAPPLWLLTNIPNQILAAIKRKSPGRPDAGTEGGLTLDSGEEAQGNGCTRR